MTSGGWITRLRRRRFAIGLIAAYAMLLSQLVSAVSAVAADPVQDYLTAHLCGPSGAAPEGGTPAAPANHQHNCKLCGPSCAVGGSQPPADLASGLISVAPSVVALDLHFAPHRALRPAPALYPSDVFSQGPPPAA